MQADGHRVHQSPDGTLLIHNLRAQDEGSYTCSAYRGSQAVSRSTEVKVAVPGECLGCVPGAFPSPWGLAVSCGRWRLSSLRGLSLNPGSLCQLLVVTQGKELHLRASLYTVKWGCPVIRG